MFKRPHICIKKDAVVNGDLYLYAKRDNVLQAMHDLGNAAFKLYVYFLCNKNEYDFTLTQKYVMHETGLSQNQYTVGLKELKDKGYMISDNNYMFDYLILETRDNIE